MNGADLLRYSILAAWAIVILGAIVLRYNAEKLNTGWRRYLAYVGYIDPQDLPGSSEVQLPQSPAANPPAAKANTFAV
jgi:hypothetical protein